MQVTPSPPVIRPGTYKKSEEKENIACASADPPTREDIIARIEKDIAFADPKICTELMEFIPRLFSLLQLITLAVLSKASTLDSWA